jgi:rhodanese-related sulfurtransferase
MNMERMWQDQLYQESARIGKSLSSPKRLELLNLLSQGPKPVELLSKSTGMSAANVSQHLHTLLEARLLRSTKKGTSVIYEIANPVVIDFMLSLNKLCEQQLVEIKRIKTEIVQHHEHMEPVTLEALMERMENDNVVLLDVRPREEYDTEHIPGALSMPVEELEQQLSELPAGVDIIAYCRGPYCFMSVQAVEMLKSKGFRAFRMEEGVHEWRQFKGGHSK